MILRIGNQTSFTAASAFEPFEFALEHGFDAFEFFPDRGPAGTGGWDERGLSLDERAYIRRAARACDIALTVHAPLAYDPMRDPDRSRLAGVVQFARDIDARLLNLHLDAGQGLETFGRAVVPVLQTIGEAGLRLALENTVWTPPEAFNALFAWLRRYEPSLARHAGMCFDLGHANACQATRNDYWAFLDRLQPEVPIIHLHLHENFGDRDSHLTLFTGPSQDSPAGLLGLLARLQSRGYQGCGILEQWPQPPELLVQARQRLQGLLQSIE